MNEFYNNHYIRVNSASCIIEGWSDGPRNRRTPTEDDILINDKGDYQFRLVIDGEATEENPPLFDGMSRIPIYKWNGTEVVRRTQEEIQADRAAWSEAQKKVEQERVANDPTTLTMEMAVDHELRIATLEMGINMGGEV